MIRGASRGKPHGALYRVDWRRRAAEKVLDWADPSISWRGSGGDRGLRGIAVTEEAIFVAAATKILVLDSKFAVRDTLANPFLHHIHEIAAHGGEVWITSTGCDSLVALDRTSGRFLRGLCLREDDSGALSYEFFDPESSIGPDVVNSIHLNNTVSRGGGLYASARDRAIVLSINGDEITPWAPIPLGSHNPQPCDDGVIFSDTPAGCAVRTDLFGVRLVEYQPEHPADLEPTPHASPGFVRGLHVESDQVIVGSSPASVSRFDLNSGDLIDAITLETNVDHAVHSIASLLDER